MLFSRGKLGILVRQIVCLGNVGTCVNLGLGGNIGLAVRMSAMPMAMATPTAMATAIVAMPCLLQVMQGVDPLDGSCILRVKGMLNNCIRKEVCSILEVVMVMGVSPNHLYGHLELVMLDASKEEVDLLSIIIRVTRVS